jgi:hypothetical protein
MSYEFERFSSREGFNRSLMHFKTVSSMVGDFERSTNLADILNEMLTAKEIEQNQLGPILYALLVDKYGYVGISHNMQDSLSDFSHIIAETKQWNAVDLVITYFHPELGLLVINPKSSRSWEAINVLKKNELVTVYAGAFQHTADAKNKKLFYLAATTFIDYLNDKKTTGSERLKTGKFQYRERRSRAVGSATSSVSRGRAKTPASRRQPVTASTVSARPAAEQRAASETAPAQAVQPASEPSRTAKRMTPFYSVPVTNELFHNGNVEAWKKIIQSYQAKYPGLDVYIFYDGERIHDIHALFKWGKVKHGSTILFAVAGEDIRDVAKLQRYLRQGASPRFEDFLRFPVNTVLKLF